MGSPYLGMKYYSSKFQPKDKNGIFLKPLDIVILGDIPWYYRSPVDYDEETIEHLKQYKGKYGIVTFASDDAYYNDNVDHPGWVGFSEERLNVYVYSRKIFNNVICSYDLWLPAESLVKIPYNSLIMNIFADYPWELSVRDGVNHPETDHFVVEGMDEYAYIKKILEAPYDKLVKAHEAAMDIIGS